jgi:UPF0716 family protein affecting phage T7 exclusion
MQADIKPRLFRAGTILLLGWLALEIVLMQIVAARIGWGLLILLMAVKGGAGILLVGAMMMRGLRAVAQAARAGNPVLHVADAGFPVAGAVLIAMPGFIPALVALALFVPAFRRLIRQRLFGATPEPSGSPRDIDLQDSDWREVSSAPSPDKSGPNAGAGTRSRAAPPLEAKPPSV